LKIAYKTRRLKFKLKAQLTGVAIALPKVKILVAASSIVGALLISITLVSFSRVTSTYYMGSVEVTNKTPFDITVQSASAEVYDSSGLKVLTATTIGTGISIPAHSSAIIDFNIIVHKEEYWTYPDSEVMTVKTTVFYDLGFFRGLSLSGTYYVTVGEVRNTLGLNGG